MSLKQDAPHPTHSCKGLPSGNLQGGEDVTAHMQLISFQQQQFISGLNYVPIDQPS
jgi:hypothetical protein